MASDSAPAKLISLLMSRRTESKLKVMAKLDTSRYDTWNVSRCIYISSKFAAPGIMQTAQYQLAVTGQASIYFATAKRTSKKR